MALNAQSDFTCETLEFERGEKVDIFCIVRGEGGKSFLPIVGVGCRSGKIYVAFLPAVG